MLFVLAIHAQLRIVACHCAVLLAKILAHLIARSSLILLPNVADLVFALLMNAVFEHVNHQVFDVDQHKLKLPIMPQNNAHEPLEINLECVNNRTVA
jgi:hypothetical protein